MDRIRILVELLQQLLLAGRERRQSAALEIKSAITGRDIVEHCACVRMRQQSESRWTKEREERTSPCQESIFYELLETGKMEAGIRQHHYSKDERRGS